MQSRSNQPGTSIETVSSDSDLVDITSVSVHRQMYDRCATNCFADELADDYVYDDDDDECLFAGGDNNASHQALSTSAVPTDVSDIPSTNGIVDTQSPASVDKSATHVVGRIPLLPPPFGFPPRSPTEIMSHAVELLDTNVQHESKDCGRNNNSMEHDNAECFKHTVSSLCHTRDSNIILQTAESTQTSGKVFLFLFYQLAYVCILG